MVMIAVALYFVLRPLMASEFLFVRGRQDRNIAIARERLEELDGELKEGILTVDEHARSRQEIEQVLAADLVNEPKLPQQSTLSQGRWGTLVVAVSVPAISVAMYLFLGNPSGLDMAKNSPSSAHADRISKLASIEKMVNGLAERLRENPDDANGWRLLARSYKVMARFPEAVAALRQARGIVGDDPDVLVELADVITAQQNGDFSGAPTELVRLALEKAPDNPQVLWMAGQSAATRGDFQIAVDYWVRLKELIPADSKGISIIDDAIAEAQKRLGLPVAKQPNIAVASETVNVSTQASIDVKVLLHPSLMKQVSENDTLFIYAQALSGPPMPLAVVRKQVKDLPIQVTLDDSMAMMPTMKLSKFKDVRVAARISKTGNAIPQPGDYRGIVKPVSTHEEALIEVVIGEKIP